MLQLELRVALDAQCVPYSQWYAAIVFCESCRFGQFGHCSRVKVMLHACALPCDQQTGHEGSD